MERHPLADIVTRNSFGLLNDITHRLTLQVQSANKRVNTPHPAKEAILLIKHKTEQLPKPVVRATAKEDAVNAIIDKSENLVREIIRTHAVGGKESRVGRGGPRQREKSDGWRHLIYMARRNNMSIEFVQLTDCGHAYLLEHLAAVASKPQLGGETATCHVLTHINIAIGTSLGHSSQASRMVIMAMTQDNARQF